MLSGVAAGEAEAEPEAMGAPWALADVEACGLAEAGALVVLGSTTGLLLQALATHAVPASVATSRVRRSVVITVRASLATASNGCPRIPVDAYTDLGPRL
jgi:hypothetical protein